MIYSSPLYNPYTSYNAFSSPYNNPYNYGNNILSNPYNNPYGSNLNNSFINPYASPGMGLQTGFNNPAFMIASAVPMFMQGITAMLNAFSSINQNRNQDFNQNSNPFNQVNFG